MSLPAELGYSQNYFLGGNKYCSLETDTEAEIFSLQIKSDA